jgi:hypothetical protein
LLTVTPEQALIDKARALWGMDDVRYEVLEQLLEDSDKFNTPSDPIEPESTDKSEINKPIW